MLPERLHPGWLMHWPLGTASVGVYKTNTIILHARTRIITMDLGLSPPPKYVFSVMQFSAVSAHSHCFSDLILKRQRWLVFGYKQAKGWKPSLTYLRSPSTSSVIIALSKQVRIRYFRHRSPSHFTQAHSPQGRVAFVLKSSTSRVVSSPSR